jgi:hypothetical protein
MLKDRHGFWQAMRTPWENDRGTIPVRESQPEMEGDVGLDEVGLRIALEAL